MSEITSDKRCYIDTRLHVRHVIRRFFTIGATLLGLIAIVSNERNNDWLFLFGVITVFILSDFIIVYRDKAYLLSYDKEHIYMLAGGCRWNLQYYPETKIAFNDIELAREYMHAAITMQQKFTPFEYIRLYGDIDTSLWDSVNHDAMEYIMILPDQLDDEQGMALLKKIYRRKPEAFTEGLTTFMESGKSWR